jgi:transposase-like protein
MQRRKFTREFKVEAARMTEERGVAVAQASRDSAPLARETGRKSPSGKGPISDTPLEVGGTHLGRSRSMSVSSYAPPG